MKILRIIAYTIVLAVGGIVTANGSIVMASLLGYQKYKPFYDFNLPLTYIPINASPDSDQMLQAIIAIVCVSIGISIIFKYLSSIIETIKFFKSNFYIIKTSKPKTTNESFSSFPHEDHHHHFSEKTDHHEKAKTNRAKKEKTEHEKQPIEMPFHIDFKPTRSIKLQNDLDEIAQMKKIIIDNDKKLKKFPPAEIIDTTPKIEEDLSVNEKPKPILTHKKKDPSGFTFDVDHFTRTLKIFSSFTLPWKKNAKKTDSKNDTIHMDIE